VQHRAPVAELAERPKTHKARILRFDIKARLDWRGPSHRLWLLVGAFCSPSQSPSLCCPHPVQPATTDSPAIRPKDDQRRVPDPCPRRVRRRRELVAVPDACPDWGACVGLFRCHPLSTFSFGRLASTRWARMRIASARRYCYDCRLPESKITT
jgi:hypothetical protein